MRLTIRLPTREGQPPTTRIGPYERSSSVVVPRRSRLKVVRPRLARPLVLSGCRHAFGAGTGTGFGVVL